MSDYNGTLVKLAECLLEKAQKQQNNKDIYSAGLCETETLDAFIDIFNFYRDTYHEDRYTLNLLLDRGNKRRSQKIVDEVVRDVKRV